MIKVTGIISCFKEEVSNKYPKNNPKPMATGMVHTRFFWIYVNAFIMIGFPLRMFAGYLCRQTLFWIQNEWGRTVGICSKYPDHGITGTGRTNRCCVSCKDNWFAFPDGWRICPYFLLAQYMRYDFFIRISSIYFSSVSVDWTPTNRFISRPWSNKIRVGMLWTILVSFCFVCLHRCCCTWHQSNQDSCQQTPMPYKPCANHAGNRFCPCSHSTIQAAKCRYLIIFPFQSITVTL